MIIVYRRLWGLRMAVAARFHARHEPGPVFLIIGIVGSPCARVSMDEETQRPQCAWRMWCEKEQTRGENGPPATGL